ncbi:MAG: ROK family protein [Thermoprotei archaeon]|nr:MAG: ROK family protein [Thermoprotei archaeon]
MQVKGLVLKYIVGVDIGATNLRIALATNKGELIHKTTIPTPRKGDELTIAETIRDLINKMIHDKGIEIEELKGIGIGSIGPLDIRKGKVINAPNIPIHSFELLRPLKDWFKIPIYVVNDCVAAVWGELIFGAGRSYQNIVYVTLSTGIGAGAIVNGNLLLGKDGNAHEVGHIVIDYESKLRCRCGGYGHWEAYASGANIQKFINYLLSKWSLTTQERNSELYKAYEERKVTTELLFSLGKRKDPLALRIIDELGRINACGIASVINVYDPELLTLGGSISLNNPNLVLNPILKYIDMYVINRKPLIKLTPLGHDVVLLGAIALVVSTPHTLVNIQA